MAYFTLQKRRILSKVIQQWKFSFSQYKTVHKASVLWEKNKSIKPGKKWTTYKAKAEYNRMAREFCKRKAASGPSSMGTLKKRKIVGWLSFRVILPFDDRSSSAPVPKVLTLNLPNVEFLLFFLSHPEMNPALGDQKIKKSLESTRRRRQSSTPSYWNHHQQLLYFVLIRLNWTFFVVPNETVSQTLFIKYHSNRSHLENVFLNVFNSNFYYFF